jgi:hypothetical protein
MKRKTKEIKDTKSLRKDKVAQKPLQLIINLTEDQHKRIKKLSDRDNQESPDIWALKMILRIVADRYNETR